ncbi:MAG: hypothetical protein L3J58_04915 [Emcibacter sp.]|nr:hypothetical protein [Emcibacter sp.]
MDIQILTTFFMWWTIINGSIYLLWTMFILCAPDLIYGIQNKFFPLPRETFNAIIYAFLGLFKIIFVTFNLAPLIALMIMG